MNERRVCCWWALQLVWLCVLSLVLCACGRAQSSDVAPRDAGASKRKALPSGREVNTHAKFNEKGRAWMVRVSLKNYEAFGVRSPLWDDKAKVFLEKFAAFRFGSNKPESLSAAKRAGDELMATGCADPYLLYIYGNIFFQLGDARKAEPFVRKGFALLEASAYPRYYLYYGAKRLAAIDEEIGGRGQEIETLTRKKMQYLGQAAVDADFANGCQRYYAELAIYEWTCKSGMPTAGEVAFQEMERLPNVDPWVRLLVKGIYHIRKGWQARGSGWASEVAADGWGRFGDELAQARKCLEAAHALHPEYPEAAAQMITVCMGMCGECDEREWFDRAVEAQFDYMDAYRMLLWALRPRWGGSHEEMYQFGVECLNTRRFDTDVPQMFVKALSDIGSELDDWRDAYKRPGVYEHAKAYYDGALAEPSNSGRSNVLQTAHAVAAWGAGRYAEASALFDQLGPGVQADGFSDFKVAPSQVLGETRLRSGPARDTFEQAEALYADGQLLNAVPLYETVRGAVASDSNALFVVNDRLAVLRLKEEYLKGGWINIMPGPELLGWETCNGDWCVEKDGALKGVAKKEDKGQLLLFKCPVGPDYEIRGEVETRYRAGVALGYMKDVTPSFAGFTMDTYKKQVYVGERFLMASSDNLRTEDLGLRNTFHVRVSNGRITAHVNDKPVFVDQAVDPDLWRSDGGQIGVGSTLTRTGSSGFSFRGLQIRKIDRAAPLRGEKRKDP